MNPLTTWKHHRDAARTRKFHEREMDRLFSEADRLREVRAAARENPPGPRLTAAALSALAAGIQAGLIIRAAMTAAAMLAYDTDPDDTRHEEQVLVIVENAVYKSAAATGFPPIVCLCGSTRFADEFTRQRQRLTELGEIVLAIEIITTRSRPVEPALKARLDELHKRKIDLADYVLVLNVGGYVGESTRSEIAYARGAGKPVHYLDPFTVPADLRPGEWTCTRCGGAWCGYQPGDGICADCHPSADERAAAKGGHRE